MEPSPNAKPVSQDLEHALSLFWGIGRVYDLFGAYIADRRESKVSNARHHANGKGMPSSPGENING